MNITQDGKKTKFLLKDGDILYMPPGTLHKARVLTDTIFYDSYE
jgi:ribosomal protein L16 Arg81 hydroxylase